MSSAKKDETLLRPLWRLPIVNPQAIEATHWYSTSCIQTPDSAKSYEEKPRELYAPARSASEALGLFIEKKSWAYSVHNWKIDSTD